MSLNAKSARHAGEGVAPYWEPGEPAGKLIRSNEDLGAAAGSSAEERTQKEAFDELFRRLWRASVQWARAAGARSQDRAEDAATQAWFRAWRYRHRYDPDRAAYATWLGAIVRNETMDLLRSESRHAGGCSDRRLEERADPSVFEEPHLFALSFVWEAFEQLEHVRPDQAAALRLKALGYRDQQIADSLGLDRVGTVGSRLHRAKRFLAERLAEKGVVFLTGHAGSPSGGQGLIPLCGTGDGGFYSVVPDTGIFLLPEGQLPTDESERVGNGFFVTVWRRGPGDRPAGTVLTELRNCAG